MRTTNNSIVNRPSRLCLAACLPHSHPAKARQTTPPGLSRKTKPPAKTTVTKRYDVATTFRFARHARTHAKPTSLSPPSSWLPGCMATWRLSPPAPNPAKAPQPCAPLQNKPKNPPHPVPSLPRGPQHPKIPSPIFASETALNRVRSLPMFACGRPAAYDLWVLSWT